MKYKGYYLHQWLAALCIFTNGLGFVIMAAGINIVNFMTVFAFMFICLHTVQNSNAIGQLMKGKKKYFLILFSVWVIYGSILGVFFGAFQNEAGLVVYRQLLTNTVFVFFTCYVVNDKKSFDLLRNVMYADLLVNIALGTVEITTGYHFIESESIWDAGSTRAFHRNPNEYAVTVYCAVVCLIFFAVEKKLSLWKKIVIVLSVLCVYTSNCRGIFYALIVYALMYVMIQIYFKMHMPTSFARMMTVAGLLVLAVITVTGRLTDLMQWITSWISSGSDQESDYFRIYLINEAMKLFKRSHGLGMGPGQSIYWIKINPHNFFAEILAEYGIVIFLVIMSIWWVIWRNAFVKDYSQKIRSMYFAFIPSLVMASVPSSSISKFKMFWILILMFYISDEYILPHRETT